MRPADQRLVESLTLKLVAAGREATELKCILTAEIALREKEAKEAETVLLELAKARQRINFLEHLVGPGYGQGQSESQPHTPCP